VHELVAMMCTHGTCAAAVNEFQVALAFPTPIGPICLVQAARLTLVQILINAKGLNMNPLQVRASLLLRVVPLPAVHTCL
jgi:hypothetical protein